MPKLQVVVGGQFGSEGKGAVAAALARSQSESPLVAIRVGGPNAGHTVIGRCPPGCAEPPRVTVSLDNSDPAYPPDLSPSHGPEGHPWRLRHVPVAAVTHPTAHLYLARGSEIDPDVFLSEVVALDTAGYDVSSRLYIDGSATVIESHHRMMEQNLVSRIGSTGKGVGAARSARLQRVAHTASDFLLGTHPAGEFVASNLPSLLHARVYEGFSILIEGTQGYGLGLHTPFYPYTTSSDCTAIDFLSQAGVSPWYSRATGHEFEVWVVFRAFPIRVAGNSGPLFAETTWEQLGLPSEFTTVTQKLRRVGQWDPTLARAALHANGGPSSSVRVAFTMADHAVPAIAGLVTSEVYSSDFPPESRDDLFRFVDDRERDLGTPIDLLGTSPSTVIDLRGLRQFLARTFKETSRD